MAWTANDDALDAACMRMLDQFAGPGTGTRGSGYLGCTADIFEQIIGLTPTDENIAALLERARLRGMQVEILRTSRGSIVCRLLTGYGSPRCTIDLADPPDEGDPIN